ncbi:ABC transporter ATP-binding protein [Mycoplasmopsis lipophila]|uniref:ABC transporter ATP-binding protein n=1 Tax=Mycoplasmopsis lipophila TaxID=2117 RepID=UPI003872D98D
MLKIMKYLPKNVKFLIFISALLALLDPLLFMILPFLTKQFIQIMADTNIRKIYFLGWKINTNLNPILVLSLLTFGFSIITFINIFLGFWVSGKMSVLAAYYLRKKLFDHIIYLSKKEIDKVSYSTIITRFSNDINKITEGLMTVTRSFIVSPGFVVFGAVFSFIISPSLSISLAIIIPLLAISALILIFKVFPLYRKENYALDALNAIAKEDINNITLIKSYNLEERQLLRYQEKNNHYLEIMKKEMNYGVIVWKMVDYFVGLGSPLIFAIIAGVILKSKNINPTELIGTIYQFNIYISMISHGVVRSFFTMNWVFRTAVSAKRFDEIMNINSSIPMVNNQNFIENTNIVFKDINFSYPNSENGIKDINLEIKPNSFVGIIGKAGSGKSTLIKLLVKEYLPDSGNIYISDKNINEIDTKNFYENISLVFQNIKILSGTIKTNMTFANTNNNVDLDWINKIKNLSCANYIDSFENLYDYEINQRGKNLSGGQKQRLAIAQAIYKKPKILILDDATNSLDNEIDLKVRSNIINEFKDSTLIMIAQRISSIKEADQIIVLDKGKIVGQGDHKTLLENNKYYQDLYYSQEGKNEQ